MPKRISDVFNVEPIVLKKLNVFNGFIDRDSKLYIDPRLLGKSLTPEFENSDIKLNNFFEGLISDILGLIELERKYDLVRINEPDKYVEECIKIKECEIREKLKFPELPLAGLGYSIQNNDGKGIGNGLADNLLRNIKSFVKLGIVDPVIFQLAGIFVENIGADRISDMIIYILLPQLAQFSSRIAKELNLLEFSSISINNFNYYNLPCYLNKVILLVPLDILKLLPTSETVEGSLNFINLEVRRDMNRRVNESFRNYLYNKSLEKELLLESPKMMTNLIETYKSTPVTSYDFTKDPENLFNWHDVARFYANHPEYSLNIKDEILKPIFNKDNEKKVLEIIGIYFFQLVKKELYKVFYDEKGVVKKEIVGVNILLQLLEYNLQDSRVHVKYSVEDKVIKIAYHYKIILKFTSTRGIDNVFYQIVKDAYFYSNSSNSYTFYEKRYPLLVFIIIVDGGKSKDQIEKSFYEKVKNSQVEVKNIVLENKFFKIVYVDARLKK